MNIAFFDATPIWSGGANRVLFLADELATLGHKVVVVCLPGGVLSDKLRALGTSQVTTLKPWSDLGIFSFIKIVRLLKEHKIEVVDINSPRFYWLALYAAKILGIKTVLTRNVPYRKKGIKKLLNGLLLFRRCDIVLSLSNKIRDELVEDYALDNISVIYDGVLDEVKNYSESELVKFRNDFGFTQEEIVLGVIGRLEESKGQIFAVQSMASIIKQNKKVKMLIVGKGNDSYCSKLKHFIAKNNLDGAIKITGFVDDISKIYAMIDILIHPSLYDNIPLCILEAFSYKKPVVASNVGGISEVVEDGVNGFLFPAGDSIVLSQKIFQLLNTDYKSMGERGYEITSKKFSKENMLENYKKLLML